MIKNKPLKFYHSLAIGVGVGLVLLGNVFSGAFMHTTSSSVTSASKILPTLGYICLLGALVIYFIEKKFKKEVKKEE